MANKKSRKLIENRNGYDINLVTEEIKMAGRTKNGKPKMGMSYEVVNPATKRVVKNMIVSLKEAQNIADEQSPLEQK